MLHLEQKKVIVEDVRAIATDAHSIVVSDYRGLTVTELELLRAQAREAGVVVRVVRNRLAKIALDGTNFDCLNEVLTGPSIFAFSLSSAGGAAKIVQKFIKSSGKLAVKGISTGEGLLGPEHLAAVAKLPTRDEALAMLMGTLQAPAGNLAFGLKDSVGRLARVMQAYADQKTD